MNTIVPGTIVLAHNLIGFRSSTLRARVTEVRDGTVWIVTADLVDVGTRLTLPIGQVVPEPSDLVTLPVARGGLIAMGG